MKYKIKKDAYEKLSEEMKKAYKADGEEFVLDIEGGEDVSALKRAKEHEKEARKAAEDALKQQKADLDALQKKINELDGKRAEDSGDVKALRASWEKKYAERENELSAQVEAATKHLQSVLVDKEAQALASELSTSPKLLLPHIKSRLRAEIVDGKPVTQILDTDGKVTVNSLDDLRKEILASEDFSPIVIGSKASGGGASNQRRGGATTKKLSEMNATEEAIFANEHPEEYKTLLESE